MISWEYLIGSRKKEDSNDGYVSDEQNGPSCVNCGRPLKGSILTLPWEDGDNPSAYITCRHCGYYNYSSIGDDD